MKITNFPAIRTYEGKPLTDGERELTLKDVLVSALNYENEKEQIKLTHQQKIRAYKLCVDMFEKKEVELKSEDIVNIKNAMEKLYSPMIYGQIIEILEPSDIADSKEIDKA